MTTYPSQTSCHRLSCLKTSQFVLNSPVLALVGCFSREDSGFLSKLVLLECVWSIPGVSVCWPFVLSDVRWE